MSADPFAIRLRRALLRGKRRAGMRGEGAPVPVRSDGYEFAELRAYVEGDDPRRIDWAATARAGVLQSRVVFEDRALVLATAVDTSASMRVGRARTLESLAQEAAAAWFGVAIDSDRCVRVGMPGRVLMLRGPRGARIAAAAREAPEARLDRTLAVAHAALGRGTHLVVVSDFLDLARDETLLRACAARFDLTTLVARDPWIDGLPLHGFVRLRDAETGVATRLFVTRSGRERYRIASAAREAAMLATLHGLGARVGVLDERGGVEALSQAFDVSRPKALAP